MLKTLEDNVVFRVVRTIAAGGMGSVYEARQVGAAGFEKRVAIKTILPEFSADQRFVDLFIQEAKLVADLVHENIVQIYQFGFSKRHGYYIVMEYISGLTLAEFIRLTAATHTRVPEELAVFIVSRIARGLAYAHTRVGRSGLPLNIVHRDVCPNNILITTEGLPKLGDFGIAKAATQAVATRGGKRSYMSPEQATSGQVDGRSDIYSLGLVLFEARRPAPAGSTGRPSTRASARRSAPSSSACCSATPSSATRPATGSPTSWSTASTIRATGRPW